jgi:hypothetical protein
VGRPSIGYDHPVSRPAHQPDELRATAFRGVDAVASGLLTPQQLRSRAWVRISGGIYAHRSSADDPQTRIGALRLLQADAPSVIVSGRTAAWLHGAWLPSPGQCLPLDVTRPVRAAGTAAGGLDRRRLVLRGTPDSQLAPTGWRALDEDVVTVDGLRVTSTLRTCFDLMRGRSLVEAVVVADAFAWHCAVPVGLQSGYLSSRQRWPGIRAARQAVSLAVDGARSPGETRLRLVLVLSGFELPLVNAPMVDDRGTVVAIPDLTIIGPDGPVAGLEYDGYQHDEGAAPRWDRRRQNQLSAGIQVPFLRYVAHDLLHGRDRIVADVTAVARRRSRWPLDDDDFRRPPPTFAWHTPVT